MDPLFEDGVPRKRLSGQIAVFVIWLAVTIIGGVILRPSPEGHGTHTQLGLPACPAVVMFDRPCPGCGLTTSWTSILHGNIGKAFAVNWMGPVLYLVFTAFALLGIYGVWKGKRLRTESKRLNAVLTPILATFLIYGFGRFFFGGRLHSHFAVGLQGEYAMERLKGEGDKVEGNP